MNRFLYHAAFAVGLLSVAWVGASYFPGNLLAMGLVLAIAVFFLMGAWELHQFQRATGGLRDLLTTATDTPPVLNAWLAPLHASLHNAVRLRVEGERVALPGPALTPYLAGLLVLLGMLGTFLGMVVTLNGTGAALQNAVDVAAIRASLVAPVKGLGLAFGTSVAGVAASAMLGLMSALARRERQRTAQLLDARIATTLRGFSRVHQREESLRLMRAQADVMPALVSQLHELVAQVGRQGEALQDRLLGSQQQFHGDVQRAYSGLAESVDRSLKVSLADSARIASAAIEPAVQATMAGLAREATTVRDTLGAVVQQHLDGVSARLDGATSAMTDRWSSALADQQRHNTAVTEGLNTGLDRFAATFEQRTAALVDGVSERLDRSVTLWTESWGGALTEQRQGHEALTTHTRDVLAAAVAGFDSHAAALRQSVVDTMAEQRHGHDTLATHTRDVLSAAVAGFDTHAAALRQSVVDTMAEQRQGHDALATHTRDVLAATVAGLDAHAAALRQSVADTLAEQRQGHDALTTHTRDVLAATVAGFDTHAATLRQSVADAHAAWDTTATQREQQRLEAFHDGLAKATATLQNQGERDAAALADRQQQICATLERTASAITSQAEAQARATIAEIGQLMQSAAEAPRAATQVIGELRQALSDSLVRDNTALDERNRLLSTLSGLLDAVNHASTEQRDAIDTLVSTTTDVLDRVGARFADTVEAESRTLQTLAAHVTGSAGEVASLGEGFGVAVQIFSRTSEQLGAQLQRIEAALGQSMARSDEQLAYYVAQAREIVDLTLGSQKQIVDDLQRLARAPEEAAAA